MLAGVAVTLQRWPIVGRRSELDVFERALGSGNLAGLVIYGRAGVGKTRLADECREQAAASGHPTERVAGSRTAALLPLGAVAALLAGGLGGPGPDGQMHTVALFEETRRALRERHRGRRLVTVADDVSLLDDVSLALLGYLAAQGTIFLIATVRTGEPVPDLVTGLWRDGRLERIDLHDLSRAHLDTLLHLALGGPIEAGAGREFWEVTRGNPLYVHELVLGALESGALLERSGVWHLEDHLPATSRLLDLVEQRIAGLSAEARSVVELLALCQPLELSYLETAAPLVVLEALERAGLVTITVADAEARLAHPLHGKVVRAAIPRMRARTILLAQAERLEVTSTDAGPAALRIAVWQLDAGGRPDPAVLVRGAQLARYAHDFRVVRRLMEAVPGDQLDAMGALLLGEALYELGVFDDSERVLARGQGLPSSEDVGLRLAVARAKNAQWGLCQPEAALTINAAARAVITSGPQVEELVADEAAVLTFSGRPDRALAVLECISGSARRTRVVRAIAGAIALAAAGRTAEGAGLAKAASSDHVALGSELAIAHPAMHIVNQVFALTEAGELAEAERLARAGAEIVASQRVPIAQIWFAANLGRVAILQGRVATARRYYAEAAGLAEAIHFAGPQRVALSGLALAHAMLGEADAAAKALEERAILPEFGFLGPEQHLADAWTAVASQRPAEAADHFRSAAAQAASTGHRTSESWLLHDLMRASGEDVSARLRDLAGACDSPLVSARARHAAAARSHDGKQLTGAAADFEAIGAMLLAAEAASSAAEAFSRAGDPRAATAALHRSSALAAACEGAVTPGLHAATVHARRGVPALGPGTRGRDARRHGHGQQGHRRTPLPVRANGEQSPAARLCKTRCQQPRRPGPSLGEHVMTPEQLALVQSSFERVGPDLPAVATRFYQELFQRDPALRALFTTDMAEQKVKFAQKLTEIVWAMPRLSELLLHTRALGARHLGYGVRAADYPTVGASLIAALAAVLGDSFDAATCEAWTLAFNLVAETMLEGAAAARPIGS
jgi:hemoglobin-like flavoprotein